MSTATHFASFWEAAFRSDLNDIILMVMRGQTCIISKRQKIIAGLHQRWRAGTRAFMLPPNNELIAELDAFLLREVQKFEPEIRDMAEYCLKCSGKKIRPLLIFAAGHGNPAARTDLIKFSAVIEMVHIATLVHDDVMDGAELRRNTPTAAKQYGSDASVLLGDAILSHAVHLAALFPTTEVCRAVSESTRKVCAGEITQTMHRGNLAISDQEYRHVIAYKTAELFAISCKFGASLAGHPNSFSEAAGVFGLHLGIAYQIYDDLTDYFGKESEIGKTLGTDYTKGKSTLPLMLLLQASNGAEHERIVSGFNATNKDTLSFCLNAMRRHGIREKVQRAVIDEVQQGLAALAPFETLPPVAVLKGLARQLTERSNAIV